MMERIIIRNFGPITNAELDIKDLTIIFGTQAAGKSVIAKLLKVFNSPELVLTKDIVKILADFNMDSYRSQDTYLRYENESRIAEFKTGIFMDNTPDFQKLKFAKEEFDGKLSRNKGDSIKTAADALLRFTPPDDLFDNLLWDSRKKDLGNPTIMYEYINEELRKTLIRNKLSDTIYIPSERNIFSLISDSVFSLSNTSIPECILKFGSLVEKSKKTKSNHVIPFISGLSYNFDKDSSDNVEYNGAKVPLSHSASGFQSSIPLALVCNNESKKGNKHFIVEEPEQNLFPATQNRLVRYLAEKCLVRSNRLLITTHSPYIISSFNNLIEAGTISTKTDKRSALMKIIPKKLWIDTSRVSAYYIDKGTAKNMLNNRYNSIDAKYLDSASDLIGNEHSKLLRLEYS